MNKGKQLTLHEVYQNKPDVQGNPRRYVYYQIRGVDRLTRQRIRKTFTDRDTALAWKGLEEVRQANAQTDLHVITSTLDQDTIRDFEEAQRRLKPKYTIREVVDYFLNHHQDPEFKIRFKEAAEKYLEEQKRELRPRTLIQLKSTLGQFEKFADNPYIHEITTALCTRFLESVKSRDGKSPASMKTWNNYRGDLHVFFEWCCASRGKTNGKWLVENPANETHKYKKIGRSREEPEILTLNEVQDILEKVEDYAGGVLAAYYAVLIFAGVRPDELKKLPKEYIRIDQKQIHIPAAVAKNHHKRNVVIQPNLQSWLEKYGTSLIPTNFDRINKDFRGKVGLSRRQRDICRHCFLSYHLAKFKSFGGAAIEAGNSEGIIREHYLDLVSDEDGAKFWEIKPKLV